MIIDNKRSLAYITTITNIKPIEGYDKVELASVGGWNVVVSKKDNFLIGDKCLYIEIDSLVPAEDKRFEFLSKYKYRIKTQKMCKSYSQGLIMPLTLFPELDGLDVMTDVMDLLHIKYYVPEDNIRKEVRRINKTSKRKSLFIIDYFRNKKENRLKFPKEFPYVFKTDEERIENIPTILDDTHTWIATEKLDGTSTTFILKRKLFGRFEFYVCSRNVRYLNETQECYFEDNVYLEIAKKYEIEKKLKDYLLKNPKLKYVCIQGETVGKVQGNPLKLKENKFYIFNFIRSDCGRLDSLHGQCEAKKMDLEWVPIIDYNWTFNGKTMEELKEFADGTSILNDSVLREGIVYRSITDNLSCKNISRQYLLKR